MDDVRAMTPKASVNAVTAILDFIFDPIAAPRFCP